MSIASPNFAQYLTDIMEQGGFDSQTEAAKFVGITVQAFNMILRGQRKAPTWAIGSRIMRAHWQVMSGEGFHG